MTNNAKTQLERILFIPDAHHPYADMRAWRLMLKAAKQFKPHKAVVLGDLVDFYTVSSHDKSPARKENLEDEVVSGNKAVDDVESIGAEENHYCGGNHEYRLDRYLMTNAPQLFSFVKTEKLFRLKERGWKYTPYQKALKIGKLYITHDEGNAGPQAHEKARASFEGNVVIGHTHRCSISYRGNARGSSHVGAMFGWLGDIDQIDYVHRVKAQQWQLGFGVGWMRPDNGHVFLQAIPIVNYSVVLNGELITG